MTYRSEIEWNVAVDDLDSSSAGLMLAERFIASLTLDSNIHQRDDLVKILSYLQFNRLENTKEAQGFISKINFVLREYGSFTR